MTLQEAPKKRFVALQGGFAQLKKVVDSVEAHIATELTTGITATIENIGLNGSDWEQDMVTEQPEADRVAKHMDQQKVVKVAQATVQGDLLLSQFAEFVSDRATDVKVDPLWPRPTYASEIQSTAEHARVVRASISTSVKKLAH